MHTSPMMRLQSDTFIAVRNPFASRWTTLLLQGAASRPLPNEGADKNAVERKPQRENAEPDEDVEDADQTAEPDGQFPDAPDVLKDTERPGATQNRHGDRGGAS